MCAARSPDRWLFRQGFVPAGLWGDVMDQYIVQCTSGSVPAIVSGQSFSCSGLSAAPDVLLTIGDYQGILLLILGVVSIAWGFRVLGSLIYRWR